MSGFCWQERSSDEKTREKRKSLRYHKKHGQDLTGAKESVIRTVFKCELFGIGFYFPKRETL